MSQTFGGFSSSIDWKQINTDVCRIIYPGHLEEEAQRVTNVIHFMHQNAVEDIGDRALKVNLILNNQSTIPNGSVSIAPWRSHFLATPPQNNFTLTALPWLDLLSIHEYRHVIQLSTARRGITNLLYYLFGQESWAGATNLAIPNWFIEGDAVWAETTLTSQGRGRTANFLKGYRALSYQESIYNYKKARNGSIRDFVPDHYRLGYLMMKYGDDNFGYGLWKKVLAEGAAFKGLFYPFSQAMRRYTGMGSQKFYQTAMQHYEQVWSGVQSFNPSGALLPVDPPSTFTNITYPIPFEGDLIYYQFSFDKIGAFYRFQPNDQSKEKLTVKGQAVESYHTLNGGTLAWTELNPHPRWGERNYRNIVTFSLADGEKRRLTHKGRYFSPHMNSSGTALIAVHQDESLNQAFHVIDAKSGEILRIIDNPQKWTLTYPKWSSEDSMIIAPVRNRAGEMALVTLVLESGAWNSLLPFGNRMLGAPHIYDEWVFYSSSTEEAENVFVLHVPTGTYSQITREPNGAFNPSFDGEFLYYTTFTADGHHVKRMPFQPAAPDKSRSADAKLPELNYERNILTEIPSEKYATKVYHPWQHAINFHTWGFFVDDPIISLRAISTNVLNNVELSAGAEYNYDVDRLTPFVRFRTAAWYPEISIEANTFRRSATMNNETRSWRETNLRAALSVDYDLSSGPWIRVLSPEIGLNQAFIRGDLDLDLSSAFAQLTFFHRRLQARKNLFTRNGQFLQLGFSESIDNLQARQFQLRSGLSLPGFAINHNLIVHADYKSDLEEGDFQFTSGLNQRGLGIVPGDKIWRWSANYHLPLVYPDWGFAGIFYIYRIRSNVFFERTRSILEGTATERSTTGMELVFDVNLVNELSTSLGIRYSYGLDQLSGIDLWEFFVPAYRF